MREREICWWWNVKEKNRSRYRATNLTWLGFNSNSIRSISVFFVRQNAFFSSTANAIFTSAICLKKREWKIFLSISAILSCSFLTSFEFQSQRTYFLRYFSSVLTSFDALARVYTKYMNNKAQNTRSGIVNTFLWIFYGTSSLIKYRILRWILGVWVCVFAPAYRKCFSMIDEIPYFVFFAFCFCSHAPVAYIQNVEQTEPANI